MQLVFAIIVAGFFVIVAILHADDTTMKVCQLSHSFETCHHTIYR